MALIDVSPPPRRSWRRAAVFWCALTFALMTSLIYVYMRPAEYRAVARLQIIPAGNVSQPAEAKDTPTVTADEQSFLTEVQALTSRPLLQEVIERLKKDGAAPDLGPDPIASIQLMLQAKPVQSTHLVELSAEGREQGLIARLVNTVIDAYRQRVVDTYKDTTSSAYKDLTEEIASLGQEVMVKRGTVDAFRVRYDIVSIEHKENDVLAAVEGLNRSYTEAKNRLAKAQARLQALRNSIASGKGVVRAKDDPTLADIEKRASMLHEQWQDLQRRFKPDYLAIDPDAQSIQSRLSNLEGQLSTQRAASQQAAVSGAQEEVSAAQAAADQLQQDAAANQKRAQEFATHLSTFKTMQGDLDHLEEMHRAALDRLAKLQASEQERAPRVKLLEAAAPSREPWRPNYNRDALIAVAGSVIFAIFAVWLDNFLTGPGTSPSVVMHSWGPAMLGREAGPAPLPLAAPAIRQLLPPPPLPRELSAADIGKLITNATDDGRLAVVSLLMGVSAEELVALRWDDIDLSAGVVRVGGEAARSIPLTEPLRGLLVAREREEPDKTALVLYDRKGDPLSTDEIGRRVLYTAFDAGLEQPDEVTPKALHYTFLVHLLRQGIRAADIPATAGQVPHQDLVAYLQIHAPATRRPLDQIDRLLPALRELAA